MIINQLKQIECNSIVVIGAARHGVHQAASILMANGALALESEVFVSTDVVRNRTHRLDAALAPVFNRHDLHNLLGSGAGNI